MRIFGDLVSGNCLKVKWTCDYLDIDYDWVNVDIMLGEAQTDDFRAKNPFCQVPVLELDDGRHLSQSNAIITYLAEGSGLIPFDAYARAQMNSWLYWEQYSHEPYVAVCRFLMKYQGKSADERDPDKVARGIKALEILDKNIPNAGYLIGESLSLADISLVAYTRVAHEGGFDLTPYETLRGWITRVENDLKL